MGTLFGQTCQTLPLTIKWFHELMMLLAGEWYWRSIVHVRLVIFRLPFKPHKHITRKLPIRQNCSKKLFLFVEQLCKNWISQSTVATVLRWGGRNYSCLCQVSSPCPMPKNIKIGQSLPELFLFETQCTRIKYRPFAAGIESSRTVLDLENSSRTKN